MAVDHRWPKTHQKLCLDMVVNFRSARSDSTKRHWPGRGSNGSARKQIAKLGGLFNAAPHDMFLQE
jgi:hypothetical protein